MPTPQLDEDLEVIAARERAGRAAANDIIVCFVDWYRVVVASHGRAAAEEKAAQAVKDCTERL